MHRFYLHDAEHAVKQLQDLNADILSSEQSREQFAVYVTERFALLGSEGNTLHLTYVGQELDNNFHVGVSGNSVARRSAGVRSSE